VQNPGTSRETIKTPDNNPTSSEIPSGSGCHASTGSLKLHVSQDNLEGMNLPANKASPESLENFAIKEVAETIQKDDHNFTTASEKEADALKALKCKQNGKKYSRFEFAFECLKFILNLSLYISS